MNNIHCNKNRYTIFVKFYIILSLSNILSACNSNINIRKMKQGKQYTFVLEENKKTLKFHIFSQNSEDMSSPKHNNNLYLWYCWIKKSLKRNFNIDSFGYWKPLGVNTSTHIPIKHLNLIHILLKHKEIQQKLKRLLFNIDKVELLFKDNNISSKYILEYFNSDNKNNTLALSLSIKKAINPTIGKNNKIKSSPSFFIGFPSVVKIDVDWAWYCMKDFKYKIIDSIGISNQLEASYQAILYFNKKYPEFQSKKLSRGLISLFNKAQLPELSFDSTQQINCDFGPFMIKFDKLTSMTGCVKFSHVQLIKPDSSSCGNLLYTIQRYSNKKSIKKNKKLVFGFIRLIIENPFNIFIPNEVTKTIQKYLPNIEYDKIKKDNCNNNILRSYLDNMYISNWNSPNNNYSTELLRKVRNLIYKSFQKFFHENKQDINLQGYKILRFIQKDYELNNNFVVPFTHVISKQQSKLEELYDLYIQNAKRHSCNDHSIMGLLNNLLQLSKRMSMFLYFDLNLSLFDESFFDNSGLSSFINNIDNRIENLKNKKNMTPPLFTEQELMYINFFEQQLLFESNSTHPLDYLFLDNFCDEIAGLENKEIIVLIKKFEEDMDYLFNDINGLKRKDGEKSNIEEMNDLFTEILKVKQQLIKNIKEKINQQFIFTWYCNTGNISC